MFLMPMSRQAFAKSACAMMPLWSVSREFFHAEKRLPYFAISIFLNPSTEDTIRSLLLSSSIRTFAESRGDRGSTPCPDDAPSQTFWICSGGMPMSRARMSSLQRERWPGRASNALKTFSGLLPKACFSQASKKSFLSTFPLPISFKPFAQASVTEPKFWSKLARKASKSFCAPASRSWKVMVVRSPLSIFQSAFTLPWKAQSSSTSRKFPKETDPVNFGSMAMRHAAAVEPCFVRSASWSLGKKAAPTFRSSSWRFCEGRLPFAAASLWLAWSSNSLAFAESSRFAAIAVGLCCARRNAFSPRCFFRLQLGSKSQMVISNLPAAGCKHLNNALGLKP
mmetsp:Transcript_91201/g.294795  ORF Transcript_91201/g.294795 Transcript_91201/m.294795 type:complete len:338 (+) Transcript_91201:658-1671(+)